MKIMKVLLMSTALAGFGAPAAAMPITGDATGGGVFTDEVATFDGWASEAASGNGVDFWTLHGNAGDELSVNVSGDTEFGVSLFGGTVGDILDVAAFSNNADFGDLSYIAGNTAFTGPFGMLDLVLPSTRAYTLAVGGAGRGFALGPFGYEMNIRQVPEASSIMLLLGGGLAIAGAGASRRRRLRIG